MKIIVAPNAFKGSLSPVEAADAMAEAVVDAMPQAEVVKLPVADGGDGTAEILALLLGAEAVACEVHDPMMRPIKGCYYLLPDRRTAVVGISAASGIALLQPSELDAMRATTYGTGELMLQAIEAGCTHLIVALGGSATCDGGTGMAQALGVTFYNRENRPMRQPLCGTTLGDISRYEMPERLRAIRFTVLCDAEAVMYGPSGAAYVYAPQKGASPEQVEQLDTSLRRYANVLNSSLSEPIENQPYTGAAGASAATLCGMLRGELVSGAEWMLQTVGLDPHLADADLLLTGEGRVDCQSVAGKSLGTLLRHATRFGVPVAVMGGAVDLQHEVAGLDTVTITPNGMPLAEAMQPEVARRNLRRAVRSYLQHLV